MSKITVSSIREKFPMYGDVSDEQLIGAVRRKYYADIPMNEFVKRIDFDTERAKLSPLSDMSEPRKFVAGYGKAAADTGRGLSQLVRGLGPQYAASADFFGLPGQSDVDEAKRMDAPLMASGAGMAGNITGNVVNALPTVAFGGGLPAAAATGGAMGFVQPVASDESRALNTVVGAGAGAAGNLLGRGINAVYQGGRALFEPFTQRGREQIAGRMIQRFADNPNSINAATSRPTITGARPTLAEQTGDAGLARLQDSLRAADPQFNNQISGRLAENNAARVNALRSLTGQDGARDFAVANRGATAQQLYGDAFNVLPDAASMTAEQSRTMQTLLKSPAIQAAMKDARAIAANSGTNVGPSNATGSVQGLHNMKMAMDDAIQTAKSAGQNNKAASILEAQKKLIGLIEDISPGYKSARVTYADMSKPINAFDIGEEVFRRATSNTSDLNGNPRMQANALMGALRDEPALIRRATGRSGNALSDILEPDQLNLLRAVAGETDRAAAVASAGNGPGSATAQRMAAQNVLRQIIGPTGLPQSWSENALANTVVGKPLNLIYGGIAEPRIQQELARAILDPDAARAVLAAARTQGVQLPPNIAMQLLSTASRSVAPAVAVGGQR